MRPSTFLVSSLAVFGAQAAPALPKLNLKDFTNPAAALDSLSSYFNLLASKVQTSKVRPVVPVCDLSKAQMPMINGLLPPSAGLTVHHVAVGRGTQNYTCDASKPDAPPVAAGALATLFNVSCIASISQDLLEKVPNMAVNFNYDVATTGPLGPMTLPVSGHHFFTDSTTPFFNLDMPTLDIGTVPCAKNSSAPAPSTAATGPQGQGAVPWLKLTAKDGATGSIKEVYRVNTAGGSPPTSCQGQPANIEVQYSAVYWFWGSNQ
ncbi:malate dehydrogenase [Trichoderma arundinaceum]|uniref:Malate dehydrogenase n=1 Tax=Trichoderma arundinaceum TaxID=490622 RepID=A0A395NFA5_TRIAR|nr:malate dehydrogenase [Trichoderma arundinaceum]